MRKFLFLIFMTALALGIISGCAEEETVSPQAQALSFEEKLASTNVNDMSPEEALLMTAQHIYNVPVLTPEVKEKLTAFFTGIQSSDYIYDNVSITPIGTITSPALASVAFNLLYREAVKHEQTNGTSTLLTLLSYEKMALHLNDPNSQEFLDYQNAVAAFKSDSTGGQKVLNDTLSKISYYLVANQESIEAVLREYEKLLLDSSSSASKSAGGGGVIGYNKFNVSANIAYMLSDILIKTDTVVSFDGNTQHDKVLFFAQLLYGITEATKLKITYDQSLIYFDTLKVIPHLTVITALVKNLLNDVITTKQIPGGAPYPATYELKPDENGNIPSLPETDQDEAASAHPFIEKTLGGGYKTADILIYQSIGEKLLGSPAGTTIYLGYDGAPLPPSNRVSNHMLHIYQRLKKNGLKAPLYTGEIGAEILTDIIGRHLRDAGIVYINANQITHDVTGSQSLKATVDQMFRSDVNTGAEAPVCALIREYNLALDNSAIGNPYNKGYYTMDADGALCSINISDSERSAFDEAAYGTQVQ